MNNKTNKPAMDEIEGQEYAVSKLYSFVKNFSSQKKKAALLYGPSGTGKTASAYAIASELGYEVVELNSSDFRNKAAINSIIGSSMQQQSLFAGGKIILIDEVEMISGTKDRGCLTTLFELLNITKYPVLLTTIDVWNHKLDSFRAKTELIKFNPLNYSSIAKILSNTCEREKIIVDDKMIEEISMRAAGDARAAINDLKTLTSRLTDAKEQSIDITEEELNALGKREQEISIFDALHIIFKDKADENILERVPLDMDECFLWIDENLPLEYSNGDLARAYRAISKADIFRKRIIRWQHWRFLTYINALITYGVSASKNIANKVKSNFVSYKKPTRILKIWLAKQKNAKKRMIAEKLAKATHCSIKTAMKDMFFIEMACRNKKTLEGFERELNLGEEEMAYLGER